MPEITEIERRLADIERTLETVSEVVLGPAGEPERSLIVQVARIRDDVGMIKKVMWFIASAAGAAVLKTLWDIIVAAGGK